tara:strand:- start:226 stop:555 length:330 start_codon:yes stop_codon:yes gene_type:complete
VRFGKAHDLPYFFQNIASWYFENKQGSSHKENDMFGKQIFLVSILLAVTVLTGGYIILTTPPVGEVKEVYLLGCWLTASCAYLLHITYNVCRKENHENARAHQIRKISR